MQYILMPFSWLLLFFYHVLNSYGLALILFAVVIKVILFPVTLKGKKSMIQTTMISGKMQQLQKQYGKDRERYNLELQKLYEREHVNPMGGCLWSMIPLVLYAVRWGLGAGLLGGFAFGVLQFMFDGGFAIGWQSIVGDYLVAFTVLGLAGLVKGKKWGIFAGTVVGCVARFLVHYVVGATVWAEYMPETFFGLTMTTPWFYSALYNGSFMLIDMVLVLVIGALLWKPLKKYITGEDLRGAAAAKK